MDIEQVELEFNQIVGAGSADRWISAYAESLIAAAKQNVKLVEALEYAAGAIEDAMGLEDGLDGSVAEAVLEILDKAAGTDLCPTKSQRLAGKHLLAELAASENKVRALELVDESAA